MRIKDIKPGGWIRYNNDSDCPEIRKVVAFKYEKGYTNGYGFFLEGMGYGLLFERKEFKYSDNIADLIKKNERVMKIAGHYVLGKIFSKEEFCIIYEFLKTFWPVYSHAIIDCFEKSISFFF